MYNLLHFPATLHTCNFEVCVLWTQEVKLLLPLNAAESKMPVFPVYGVKGLMKGPPRANHGLKCRKLCPSFDTNVAVGQDL